MLFNSRICPGEYPEHLQEAARNAEKTDIKTRISTAEDEVRAAERKADEQRALWVEACTKYDSVSEEDIRSMTAEIQADFEQNVDEAVVNGLGVPATRELTKGAGLSAFRFEFTF